MWHRRVRRLGSRAAGADVALDRPPWARRTGHRRRDALLDRDAPARDHRRRDRRPTDLQRRPQPRTRVQRRDLQPRRAAPGARAARSTVRHPPFRQRGHPARLRGVGSQRRRPSDRNVRLCDLGSRTRRALPRARPPRYQAALLRRRSDRLRVRVRAEGALPGRARGAPPRSRRAAALSPVPCARRRRGHLLRRGEAFASRALDARPARRHRLLRRSMRSRRSTGIRR